MVKTVPLYEILVLYGVVVALDQRIPCQAGWRCLGERGPSTPHQNSLRGFLCCAQDDRWWGFSAPFDFAQGRLLKPCPDTNPKPKADSSLVLACGYGQLGMTKD